ncbi:two-partner secretion domain-containing protein [Trichormus variabilis]|uniref:two-partner secretion domain-containing protein n=1 Tax=Anabaena variabilis TaxID=264691 RepID=UPI00162361BA|nr:filamentous hemagglutinin N-terminal domain-containing protein [Trichormus variabilis]MBC1326452.1 filamentous hemagglutinin N-terminal domain-containing protein [Trichormus variabilis 9RC]
MVKSKFLIWNISILLCLLNFTAAKAEIIPDTTLPNNSTVRPVRNIRVIEGGTQRGENLFHSFREFSFSALTTNVTGNVAIFNHNLAVRNIITRITGGSPSYIDGLITATSGSRANLFLINPQGIIFGANASLNIGGSFLATTANSIKFADGVEFNATTNNNTSLLTVNVPVGLQFGDNPGNIEQPMVANLPLELQVRDGRTLGLIGGNLLLESSLLEAPGGRVELGSVSRNGFVSLSQIDDAYVAGYSGVQDFGDINLAAGTLVNSGSVPMQDSGGAIQIQGRNVTIDDSLVFTVNSGSQTGNNLVVNASESLKVGGTSNILTIAQAEGKAGDIWITAKDSVELREESFIGSQVCSLGGNCANVTGNGGNLTIETGRLLLTDGAGIEASTFGAGNTGNILVRATDSIDLRGESPDGDIPSGIFAQVSPDAPGNAGNTGTITLQTRRLNIQGGAQISNVSRYGSQGGDVLINASAGIQVSGASQFTTASSLDIFRSGIFAATQAGTTTNDSTLNINTGLLTVENGARLTANNLNIVGDRLIVQNGAEVTVAGESGNLSIKARSLKLDNQSQLIAQTTSGNGGNITLNLSAILRLRLNSQISTFADGNGGNIEINSPFIVATPNENNDIVANVFGGAGGRVTISTQKFLGLVVRNRGELEQILGTTDPNQLDSGFLLTNDIVTFSQTSPSLISTATINRPDVDSRQRFAAFPTNPINTSRLTQVCSSDSRKKPRLKDSFQGERETKNSPSPHHLLTISNFTPIDVVDNPDSPKIVEAQGWVIDTDGNITLVAPVPTVNHHYPWFSSTICHIHE